MKRTWTLEEIERELVDGVDALSPAETLTREAINETFALLKRAAERDNWALQMLYLLGSDQEDAVRRWMAGKSAEQLEAARQHALFIGEFPPPERHPA